MNLAVPLDAAEAIAKLYRRLVLLVGLQIVLGLLAQTLPAMGGSMVAGLLSIVVLVGLLCILAMLATTAYKLTEHLGAGTPILWAIAMFLPCINILTLLVLSSKAQTWCRQYGIKVGFLGPTPESIEEVRRRAVTSKFE
jgi:cell division protein FtsX